MTVVRAELTDDVPSTTSANLHAIKVALETKGVVFGDDGMIGYQPKDAQR